VDLQRNMQAAEDFSELVLEAHIVATAKKEYNSEHTVNNLSEHHYRKVYSVRAWWFTIR
jgi:capsular polysaccharide biosynthesis protein